MTHPARSLVALCAVAAPVALAAEPGKSIADLAPKRSFAVVSVPSWTEFRAAFDRSELGALWAEPSVQTWVEDLAKEPLENLDKWLSDAGTKRADLEMPTGAVGFAVFMVEPGGTLPEPPPAVLLTADFGPGADGWSDLVQRVLDRGKTDGEFLTEEDQYAGVTVTTIKPAPKEPQAAEDEGAPPQEGLIPGLFLLEADTAVYLARAGDVFVVSTDKPALEGALDGLAGRAADTVASTGAFRDSLAQHPDGGLAVGVLIVEPLLNDMVESLERDGMVPGGADPQKLLDTLGVSAVRAASFSMRLATQEGIAEQTIAVLATEKKGLLSLVVPVGPFDPPAFVGPDASAISRFGVAFDGLIPLARAVLEALPEEIQTQANTPFNETASMIGPGLDAMGPTVHIVTTLTRPLDARSQSVIGAIEVRDPLIVGNTITFLNTQAGGFLTARDFEGNVIYDSENIPIALGLGFGQLFIGAKAGVENLMRAAGHPGAERLATEPAFRGATATLAPDGVAYDYTRIRDYLAWDYWMLQHPREYQIAQFDQLGLDEQTKEMILEGMDTEVPPWAQKLPPLEVVLKHLGDIVYDLRPTPDGFRGRTLWLRPE